MALWNSFGEFVPGRDCWQTYSERLKYCFVASKVADKEEKKAIFFTVCGAELYNLAASLCLPKATSEVDIETICTALSNHFNPKPSEIVETYKFHKRDQQEGETISDYVAELRRLSAHCNFTDLNRMLRDRVVCGVRDRALQHALLAKDNLTFQIVLDMATAAEAATRNVSDLKSEVSELTEAVNQVGFSRRHVVFQDKGRQGNRAQDKESQGNKATPRKPTQEQQPCWRCNGLHSPENCKHRSTRCNFCSKRGHLERACISKRKCGTQDQEAGRGPKRNTSRPSGTFHVTDRSDSAEEDTTLYSLYQLQSCTPKSHPPIKITVHLDGRALEMEVDTGAGFTVISSDTFQRLWPDRPKLQAANLLLHTWSQEKLRVLGSLEVLVQTDMAEVRLPLLVAEGCGPSLLGRSWLDPLGITVEGILTMNSQVTGNIVTQYANVFASADLGQYVGPPVCIDLEPDARPIFHKCRHVAFALREAVGKEIDRLVERGVYEPVTYSKWATPIVTVCKADGSVRICGDYKISVNQVCKTEIYPLPTTDEAFSNLSGGKLFTKLDLADAYLQVSVDESTADILTVNTMKGLYRVKRLPFGIKCATAVFQRLMETMLSGIDGVVVLLDDILIMGTNAEQHWQRVHEVLSRVERAGLRLKGAKCVFAAPSVKFLGYRVDSAGIHPTSAKVEAIHHAPAPKCKKELQAFLGLLNFYDRFLHDKASIAEPLHRLLDKGQQWEWTKAHDDAFGAVKGLLQSDAVLVHYDVTKPVTLTCDASDYGLGAVLAHVNSDGTETAIAFASRTLHKHERNYAQIDKEALAIMFGVTKFRQYVTARPFTIITDHQPLLYLLDPNRQTPDILSPRLLRWNLLLSMFDYKILYRPGTSIAHADALSRLPMEVPNWEVPAVGDVLMLEGLPDPPVEAARIAELTEADAILHVVKKNCIVGWPGSGTPTDELRPYWTRRNELSLYKGCILWGSRVVIPLVLRKDVLEMLHAAHDGVVKSKAVARSYMWWPKMDGDIEEMVGQCRQCQQLRANPRKQEGTVWEQETEAWTRVHVDFFGPFQGKVFLIAVDAHSKWPEVRMVGSMSSATVVRELRDIFSVHGLPECLVSDNGCAFVSREMKDFARKNGVRLMRTTPFHPSSNGQAERMVQTVKAKLKKVGKGDWQTRLARILFSLRTTPVAGSPNTPADLLMRRTLRTALDQLRPSTRVGTTSPQPPSGHTGRCFSLKDAVWYRVYNRSVKWMPGIITGAQGQQIFVVKGNDGQEHRRHKDQILRRERGISPGKGYYSQNPLTELPTGNECVALRENSRDGHDGSSPQEGSTPGTREHTGSTGWRTQAASRPQSMKLITQHSFGGPSASTCDRHEPAVEERTTELEEEDDTGPFRGFGALESSGKSVDERRYPTRVRRQPEKLRNYTQ